MSVLKNICDNAEFLSEEDLDKWILPQVMDFYSDRFSYYAYKAFGSSNSPDSTKLSRDAFKEFAKDSLRDALKQFLFEQKHWVSGRDLNPYLLTTLNRLSDNISAEVSAKSKVNFPICPGCRDRGKRIFLIQEDKLLRCPECTAEIDRLEEEKKSLMDSILISKLEAKIKNFKYFALHSKKGYRCPECSGFIPASSSTTHGVSCPYNDCFFFGQLNKLETMSHPVGSSARQLVSLQMPIGEDQTTDMQDVMEANTISPQSQTEIVDKCISDLELLYKVIDEQIESIKRTGEMVYSTQKLLMHQAFRNTVDQFPEDMVAYLVHRKLKTDFPLQAKIFQNYVELVKDALPLTIKRPKYTHEIVSLLDPELSLFLGISEFESEVKDNHLIPNMTEEMYSGGRKFSYDDRCFIGYILDLIDIDTGESLKDKIQHYGFISIKMKSDVCVGTRVRVRHYRIASHYEIGSMIYLQKARKRIVERIEKTKC